MSTDLKHSKMSLEEKDKKYLWHPFTQMQDWEDEDLMIIQKGEGVYLEDSQGHRYIDGVSSLWCNVHGHQVPEIDQAVAQQLKQVAHSTFLGLTHPPAIELAERLVRVSPEKLTRVFYSDSGSEAVEIALKMAYQYWQQKGNKKKTQFVHLAESYHGDTLGAVSVGGIGLFHEIYHPLLFKTLEAPAPHPYRWPGQNKSEEDVLKESIASLESIFKENHETIAAFVMEPLMQGAAGMIKHPKGFLAAARKLADQYDILLILDEVATGFGRTGTFFACEQEGVTPDLMAVAKGITGGYLPLAATLATEDIYRGFLGKYDEFKAFFHGHTYTANPLACAAANATLDLFETKKTLKHCEHLIQLLEQRLEAFRNLPIVGDIRQSGLMVGIELVKDRETKQSFDPALQVGVRVIKKARQKGAILRPLGPVIILMPPLAISETELNELIDISFQSIQEVQEELKSYE